jgi:hypothetical protein
VTFRKGAVEMVSPLGFSELRICLKDIDNQPNPRTDRLMCHQAIYSSLVITSFGLVVFLLRLTSDVSMGWIEFGSN